MSQGGGGSGDGALVPEPQPQQVVRARTVHMAAEMLDCHTCHLPLKPPIFKCDANHLMCSFCRGAHGESCGRTVAHSTLADDFAAAVFVPCDYEKHGCKVGGVVYHEAAYHRRACQHAPCGCPERCGFSGSLQNLLKHVSEHSRAILVIRYGQLEAISLPLSRRWQVLVGEDDNDADRRRSVFLLSASERGAEEVEVSLVCIRADGGVPPQFSCKIAVEHSDDGTRQTLESPVMKSSSLSSIAPAPGEMKCLRVKKDYLTGDSVPVTVYIDRLAHPPPFSPKSPAFSPKPPPFSPTHPFSPKSPPFSPTNPFSPKLSPKRPFSPMSPAAEGKVYKKSRK
ncbi:putative E3 ubiquitin-protein ligase SINA-like 6 [Lolium rigidum]|uniref:putative E3 ubiquitin-protein ligase SINA-like 6 n=1 Tax=Lolium rigidum TaxID=89674 RepID=UPI001F5D7912|nr:putative E3 ubiquitin-protein ligase SINA-like 6 [Lolium rigidum]